MRTTIKATQRNGLHALAFPGPNIDSSAVNTLCFEEVHKQKLDKRVISGSAHAHVHFDATL